MKTNNVAETLFTACATCTVVGVGAALAVLLYEILTISLTLVES